MLKKITKPVNVIYLLLTACMLLLTLLFMTGYQALSIVENSDLTNQTAEVRDAIMITRDTLQTVNNNILYLFVIAIVSYVVLQIFGNGYRKKLYKSNLIVGIVLPSLVIAYGIFTLVMLINALNVFQTNYDVVYGYLTKFNTVISDAFTINLSLVAVGLYIVVNGLYIAYTVLKYRLDRKVA